MGRAWGSMCDLATWGRYAGRKFNVSVILDRLNNSVNYMVNISHPFIRLNELGQLIINHNPQILQITTLTICQFFGRRDHDALAWTQRLIVVVSPTKFLV